MQDRFKQYKQMDSERAREAALAMRLEAAGKRTEAAPHRARATKLAAQLSKMAKTLKSTEPGGYQWKKARGLVK